MEWQETGTKMVDTRKEFIKDSQLYYLVAECSSPLNILSKPYVGEYTYLESSDTYLVYDRASDYRLDDRAFNLENEKFLSFRR